MATRSRIGMEMKDGSVKSIYCHWDGYPSHNGRILQENYQDRDKVTALIELGDISSLAEEVVPTGPHSFNDPQGGVVVAYHRDRGEELCGPRKDRSVDEFVRSDVEEYGYLFTQEGEWVVVNGHESASRREPVQVDQVLSGTVKL